MLIVVEGISAAGKTIWCGKHVAEVTVPETGPRDDAPDPVLDPIGAARFWVEQGERRWLTACAIERSKGYVVCDTDPLKLHYVWSLWQIGVARERYWQASWPPPAMRSPMDVANRSNARFARSNNG